MATLTLLTQDVEPDPKCGRWLGVMGDNWWEDIGIDRVMSNIRTIPDVIRVLTGPAVVEFLASNGDPRLVFRR